jgi:nitrogen regulatory protein P-II 1
VKIEIVIPDTLLNPVLETLTTAARTGKIGDGKIFVSTIDDAIRIRNGDHGEHAL